MDDKIQQVYRVIIYGNDVERENALREILEVENVSFVNKERNNL